LLEADAGPTPYADRYMEEVFQPRFRVIFDRLCDGSWGGLAMVVLSRASEQEHKLYLYLREACRQHISGAIPRLYLYNLLHTRTPEAYDYGVERTRQMVRDFEVTERALVDAIAESNRARDAVREIQRKRYAGLLEGSTALQWIRRFYSEDRSQFAADTGVHGSPVAGDRPRILFAGAPPGDASLHRLVELAGGYVVAEDDWRGSRAAGEHNVRTDMDPVTAIFEKYFYDETSPRIQTPQRRDAWLHREIAARRADGVVFYIPLEDDVAGWDYPRQSAWLARQGVPSLLMRDLNAVEELCGFLQGIARVR
jgi:hypothetical protein